MGDYKRVLVIGAKKVGKTNLLSVAINNEFTENYARVCPLSLRDGRAHCAVRV
jgi:GTPase SAR1 family protein